MSSSYFRLNDGHVRAAVIMVGESGPNQHGVVLRRSIKHLYPTEVQANKVESNDQDENLKISTNLRVFVEDHNVKQPFRAH